MLSGFQEYAEGLAGFFHQTPAYATDSGEMFLDKDILLNAHAVIESWDGYSPTKLHNLAGLASRLGVGAVQLKDESTRFGLGTFKALGGGYAIDHLSRNGSLKEGDTVTCATDGNHGRGVAWAAKNHNLNSVVYIPSHVSTNREAYIKRLGAEVIRVNGSYEDALDICTQDTKRNKWTLISDTATETDVDVPKLIMSSYTIVAKEITNILPAAPTHVFVPAGVGGLASSVAEYLRQTYLNTAPQVIAVEPEAAACLYDSFRAGKMSQATGNLQTFMGCLACGRPATIPWKILSKYGSGVVAVKDASAMKAQRDLANGTWGDSPLEGGESGIAALAGFLSLASSEEGKNAFGINEKSRIVVLMTEGPTDHAIFYKNVGRNPSVNYG